MSGQETGEDRAREFSDWWRDAGEGELRQLLYWVWDPIGLNQDFPDASDEYDRYALEVATALASGMSQSTLAALLGSIEQNRMAMRPRPLGLIAERLRTWYQRSTERYRARACAGVRASFALFTNLRRPDAARAPVASCCSGPAAD